MIIRFYNPFKFPKRVIVNRSFSISSLNLIVGQRSTPATPKGLYTKCLKTKSNFLIVTKKPQKTKTKPKPKIPIPPP